MNKIKDDEAKGYLNKKAWKAYERAFGRNLRSFVYGKKEINKGAERPSKISAIEVIKK